PGEPPRAAAGPPPRRPHRAGARAGQGAGEAAAGPLEVGPRDGPRAATVLRPLGLKPGPSRAGSSRQRGGGLLQSLTPTPRPRPPPAGGFRTGEGVGVGVRVDPEKGQSTKGKGPIGSVVSDGFGRFPICTL